jgi:hypothetical protein
MRLTLEFLGHTLTIAVDHPEPPEQYGSDQPLDAYVERADPYTPVLGFGPHPTDHRQGGA